MSSLSSRKVDSATKDIQTIDEKKNTIVITETQDAVEQSTEPESGLSLLKSQEASDLDGSVKEEEEEEEEEEEDFVDFRQATEEEEATLPRTTGTLKWYLFLLLLVEFAERASYFGVSNRLNNFIELPLPTGSKTGKVMHGAGNAGALDMGLSKANSTSNAMSFFAYCFPLVTSYLADMYFKRMTMLKAGVFSGIAAHIIFIIASIPSVIAHPNASYGILFLGVFVLSWCTAFIKPCLLPTLLQQYPHEYNVVTKNKNGQKIILDREQTLQKLTNWFYFAINIGAITDIGMGYAARDVGYWCAFLIPLCIFMILPVVLYSIESKVVDPKPVGHSILNDVAKILKVALEGNFIKRIWNRNFWEYSKPSVRQEQEPERLGWRKRKAGWYSERLVEDTRITLSSCVFFLYYVMFNINDMGLSALLNNLSASMKSDGVPNDVINNFNPLAIICFIPFLDLVFYPLCNKVGIKWTPVWKIFTGFMLCALAMAVGAILQSWVYKHSPCGDHASTCTQQTNISLWTTAIIYALTGFAECFAMTSAYTIAFVRAPNNMKSFVMALFLFQTAIAAIIGIIVSPALVDPLLVRVFSAIAGLGAAFAFGFLIQYWNLDKTMEREAEEQRAYEESQREAELLAECADEIKATSYELNAVSDESVTHRHHDLENISPVVSAKIASVIEKK